MGQRDRRHLGAGRRRGWIWWLPLALVLVLPAAGFGYLRATHRANPLPFPVPGLPTASTKPLLALPAVGFPADPTPAAGGPVSPAKVRAALAAALHGKGLGGHVHVVVGGLSGGPVFKQYDAPMVPASTLKLLTTTTALHLLGPERTFRTTVTRPNPRTVVLVGGGDPYLEARPEPGAFPARADLATLATQVAQEVGTKKVRLGFDDTLFSGPAINPEWPATYIPENVVAPVSALWVNRGWTRQGVVADPALVAARKFRSALVKNGVHVIGEPTRTPGRGPEIAAVSSAPLGDIVESILTNSDNEAAEVVARQAALAVGQPGSFSGAAAVVRRTLTALGVPLTAAAVYDGSGLSRKDRLTPSTLLAVLRLAATDDRLRPVITGLPIGGFSGSLADRFGHTPRAADGLVRAKTGTLTGVSGLAGIAQERGGSPVLFVVLSDHVRYLDTLEARDSLDKVAAALATCACG